MARRLREDSQNEKPPDRQKPFKTPKPHSVLKMTILMIEGGPALLPATAGTR